jgi:hypothetical protein
VQVFIFIGLILTCSIPKSNVSIKFYIPDLGSLLFNSNKIQGSFDVIHPNDDTNEFNKSVIIKIKPNIEPIKPVYVCLKSTDVDNGGTISNESEISTSTICANYSNYLAFHSENWTSYQFIKIIGSRGSLDGVQTNHRYDILFDVQTEDENFLNTKIDSVSITNINIDLPGEFFVRVQVSGLSGGSLSLLNNNSNSLTILNNGLFNFSQPILDGANYSVSITSFPNSKVCSISNLPFGIISGNHIIINVLCVNGYLFNGTLLGESSPPTLNQSFSGLVTIAGNPPNTAVSGYIDGLSMDARFYNPIAITTDGKNLYIADIFNNVIRKIVIGTNSVSTLASIINPHGVTTDGINVYATSFSQNKIYKIDIQSGIIELFAGSTVGDLDGSFDIARFNVPTYLTTDGKNVYVVDRSNGKVKKIVISSGNVTTLVSGLGSSNGITTDGSYLYIAETSNHRIIRVLLSDQSISIIAGTGVSGNVDNPIGLSAQFRFPYGLTMDGSYLYILEGAGKSLKKMSLTFPHSVSTILSTNNGYEDGEIGTAKFCNMGANCDSSLTFDGNFLYLADRHNHSIRKLTY